MNIIYCHHAQRLKGNPSSQDDGLTDIGIRDAMLIGEIFAKVPNIKAIVTSPFFRCKETARLISCDLNVEIIEDDRFNEFGSIEGESWVDLQNRVISAINDIVFKYDNEDNIICVTSGVNLGAFMVWSFGQQPSENTPFLGVSSCSPIIFNYDKSKK